MADDFTCWLAVVGLPSVSTKEQIGPGKSCLCNRFIRPKEDDFNENHSSGVSNQDFCGQIINNENFLYWGYVKKSVDNMNFGLRIIEHTHFYDDNNFKPFGSNEPYLKRAKNPKITTHGTKYQYIDTDQLAFGDKDSNLERFPCEKSDKVVIDSFIYVFDVSREDVHFVEQYNLAESFIKAINKPCVLALSKFDEFNCKHIEAIKNLSLRNKAPVVEISARKNINIDTVFMIAAKLARQNNKSTLKNLVIPTYEDSMKLFQKELDEVSRLFNQLTETSVVNKDVSWFEFKQYCKENKHFQKYCEFYGTNKAKQIFVRHIRNLTKQLNEKNRNLYLKDLSSVFNYFIDTLSLSEYKTAIESIRNHPDFNEYFVALSDEKTWKSVNVTYSPTTKRILIPLDLLLEAEAMTCFDNRITELEQEKEQVDLADEFERSLTLNSSILPGLSLEDVLGAVDEKFEKLDKDKSRSIYSDHQLVITKQYEKEFGEMLLENTELFRVQLPGVDMNPFTIQALSTALKEDHRWSNMVHAANKRDCLLLQHIAMVDKGLRKPSELSSVEKRYKSLIIEKTMARKELSYATNLNVNDGTVNVIVMPDDEAGQKWVEILNKDYSTITVDGVEYNVNVSAQDPDTLEIAADTPVHTILGLYSPDNWESFRSITRSFDTVQKKCRGLPCQIVYLRTESDTLLTVTQEEGSRFASRLNCKLISEEELQDTILDLLSSFITLLGCRTEFVATPSAPNRTVLNLTLRMLYDDDINIKDITSSLFNYHYSFVHPYEQGVYVLHTLLKGAPVFVMTHLLHYLDKESYQEHGCILISKDSRKASLENARFYMSENNVSESLGLIVVQTPSSLPFTSVVTQTAAEHGIQCVMLEQEQHNRRLSVGQQTTAIDTLLLHVLQNSLQFIGPEEGSFGDTSDDDTSINEFPFKLGDQPRHRASTLDRLGFASPPPHGSFTGTLPDRFKHLSVSWNDVRGDGQVNHPWSTLPRNLKGPGGGSLDKTPPIYAVVNKNPRRGSAPFDPLASPKSPPIPPRLNERHFSETSSEGFDPNDSKSGGMVTSSVSDSPFKNKRIPKVFNKNRLTEEELEQKRLNKVKKREDKELRKRKAKEIKMLEKNKKIMANKKDLANVKSFIPDYKMPEDGYFGKSLAEIAPYGGVPYYISLCVEYLECHDLTIEGLYRKEGNKLQIDQLERSFKMAFEGVGMELSKFNIVDLDVSVHVVASSIKKFFKRLPTPLIPHEFQDLLLVAVEINQLPSTDYDDHVRSSICKVLEIINTFERQRKLTLAYLIRHLSRIAELKDQNKMTAFNLAIIFWPTLLQPTQDVLMKNEDRTKFSNMAQFLIENADALFGPELPSCPPPDDEDIYDMVFHPELVKQKTLEEYEYIKRPKTYFNQPLRVGHVPSLVKQCVTFIDNGKITTNLYVYTAREDLVDNFVKVYETAYAVDEHRTLNLRKILKNLTIARSPTDDSISASTTTDDNSVSSTSGDLSSLTDGRFGAFEEQTMDCTILATVLKRYLSGLIVPVIPPELHGNFLEIASVPESEREQKIRDCFDDLKTSHKIILSYLMEHFSRMKDKGVLQLHEVFAPILFYGNTTLTSTDLTDLTAVTAPVPITYSPNMTLQQRVVTCLIDNVHLFVMQDGVSLYAPLYETMEQEQESLSCHQYSSIQYSLPSLPEDQESRLYDLPCDPSPLDPLYSDISNPYSLDPGYESVTSSRPVPPVPDQADPAAADPPYSQADDLYEFYEEDGTTPSSNSYVEHSMLSRQTSSNLPPNR